MLHNTVLVSVVHRSESAIRTHMSPYTRLLTLPPILPIPPLSASAKHRADLPVLCCRFPLANYFMFSSVFMLMLLSFHPSFPLPPPCPQVHSLCLCLYSCPATRFISTIFFLRFRIYVLAYCICFSLSDLLHSVWQTISPPTSLEITQFLFYGWVIFHCIYVPHLLYPFICWWTFKLLPCPGYCK